MLKSNTTEFVKKARIAHGDLYDYSLCEYMGSKKKVIITCRKHGAFLQTPNNHLRSGGCNKCGYERISENTSRSNETFVEMAKIVHGEEYDYTKTVYKSALSKVVVTCKVHGDFTVEANAHLKGVKCLKCSQVRVGIGNRGNTNEFKRKAEIVHGNTYCYDDVNYVTNSEVVTIRCKIHGVFRQTPNDHLDGCGCPSCNARGYNPSSVGYLYLLRSENGEYIKIGITNNIKGRIKRLRNSTPFDFNLIEYNRGEGFHIREMEKLLHSEVETANMKGFDGCTEWFKFDERILSYFKKVNNHGTSTGHYSKQRAI